MHGKLAKLSCVARAMKCLVGVYLMVMAMVLHACLAFAPPKFVLPLPQFDVEDPTTSPICKGTPAVPYYFDVLVAKGRRRQVPRWSSRTLSALWAAAEQDNYYHGKDTDNYLFGEKSKEMEPILAANNGGVGGYNPAEKLGLEREAAIVGDPQVAQLESMNITMVLTELQAIQSQGPKKYCILGTRHCSFLHQQIVEMLAYALVLSGNHIYTSGAAGTNAAAIRGALRAFQPQLLTVVLPQSMSKQTPESQELLQDVTNIITMPQNDAMPLDVASRICNSHLLSQTDQLISFAFHDSKTVLEAAQEAQKLNMLVTLLYLD